jgi:hypothetical protein
MNSLHLITSIPGEIEERL